MLCPCLLLYLMFHGCFLPLKIYPSITSSIFISRKDFWECVWRVFLEYSVSVLLFIQHLYIWLCEKYSKEVLRIHWQRNRYSACPDGTRHRILIHNWVSLRFFTLLSSSIYCYKWKAWCLFLFYIFFSFWKLVWFFSLTVKCIGFYFSVFLWGIQSHLIFWSLSLAWQPLSLISFPQSYG